MPTSSELLRGHAEAIWQAALNAVRPQDLLRQPLLESVAMLSSAGRVLVIGAGKAGAAMAEGAEEALVPLLARVLGKVSVPAPCVRPLRRIELVAGRPANVNEPDRTTLEVTKSILDLVRNAKPDDGAIALISGGGSALLESPVDGVTIDECRALHADLQAAGAPIQEMNTVRKHLSQVKGGQLAQAFQGRYWLSLIISDVIGDPLDAIASGPSVADPTTFHDALAIIDRYHLGARHSRCTQLLQAGARGERPETPKALPENFVSRLVGNNATALAAAEARARDLGYAVVNLGGQIGGDTQAAAEHHVRLLLDLKAVTSPVCLLSGGETTVSLGSSHGKGGRNQEFALAALSYLGPRRFRDLLIASIATDGEDGPTDAAGAFADETTANAGMALGLDPREYLARHDSYAFFQAAGGLIKTGLTETNVMDLHIALAHCD